MVKNTLIALGILLLVTIGCIWWFFKPVKKTERNTATAICAIPINASIIIEIRNVKTLKAKIDSVAFWDKLCAIDFFAGVNKKINSIDSVIKTDIELASFISNTPFYLSAHPSGVDNHALLLTIPINADSANGNEKISRFFKNHSVTQRNYEEAVITSYANENETTYTAINKNIVLISTSSILIEDAIRQQNISTNLLSNQLFERLYKTQNEKNDLGIYININQLPSYLETFINPTEKKWLHQLNFFSDWIILDGTLKNESLLMNGYSATNDSGSSFINIFKNQEPQRIQMTSVIPINTSFLMHFGVNNFKNYLHSYTKFLGDKNNLYDFNQAQQELFKKYKIDFTKLLIDHIDNELGILSVPFNANKQSNFAIFKTKNSEIALSAMQTIADSAQHHKKKKQTDTLHYKNYVLIDLKINSLLGTLLGKTFNAIKQTHCTLINEYLIFGNSSDDLSKLIDCYDLNKTLENSPPYAKLTEQLSAESNLFIYANSNKGNTTFSNLLNDEYQLQLEESSNNKKAITAFAIQISSTSSYFYVNSNLLFNTNSNKNLELLFETNLDTTCSSAPHIVINHETNEKEIVVQDDGNKLYLIGNNGKILWKRKLPEKIKSNIFQIDIKKNNKLQLAFNTASAIYVIDRKGNFTNPFPIKLPEKAASELSVFDFENNKDYHFMVAGTDEKLYDYKTNGKKTNWELENTDVSFAEKINYLKMDDAHHLIGKNNKGELIVANLTNKKNSNNIPLQPSVNYHLISGETLTSSKIISADSTGTITSIDFNGATEQFTLNENGILNEFEFNNFTTNDSTPAYILTQTHAISCYNKEKKLLFNFDTNEELSSTKLFLLTDSTFVISTYATSSNEIILLNKNGILVDGFPLAASNKLFTISSWNNLNNTVLACSNGKQLTAFKLK